MVRCANHAIGSESVGHCQDDGTDDVEPALAVQIQLLKIINCWRQGSCHSDQWCRSRLRHQAAGDKKTKNLASAINYDLMTSNLMKQKLTVLAALLFAFGIHAALVEYSYTGRGTCTGAGNLGPDAYSGIMIYDTGSSNVTFVGWQTEKVTIIDTITDTRSTSIVKIYWVNTDTNLHFTTITGPKSKTYTVMTRSSSGTDTNGLYHLDDYMISGQNETLPIATNATFVFPERLTGSNNREIYRDTNGNPWLETWGETMTFYANRTKSDNDGNLSRDEAVNAIVTGLQNKGYSERN
jgi:hypothetical protein